MPMHDWTRVSAGTFHSFHTHWISSLARELNDGLLPENYYCDPEQVVGETIPDVLTLETVSNPDKLDREELLRGGHAHCVTDLAPRATLAETASELEIYSRRRNRLAIRHSSGDRVVAFLEIVSRGNKSGTASLHRFLDKAYSIISEGIHLMVLDCYPPTTFDPEGMHCAIWSEFQPNTRFRFDSARPLTFASYKAGLPAEAYVEPIAVGQTLPSMPLFLNPDWYVNIPLESTYQSAFAAMPKRWQTVLTEA